MKSIIRCWIWFIVLNLVTNFIFTESVAYGYWQIIEIVLFIISAIMVDWE